MGRKNDLLPSVIMWTKCVNRKAKEKTKNVNDIRSKILYVIALFNYLIKNNKEKKKVWKYAQQIWKHQNAMPAEKRMTICNDKNIVFITRYYSSFFPRFQWKCH